MKRTFTGVAVFLAAAMCAQAQNFELKDAGYFNCEGIDVMAFSDFYPEGSCLQRLKLRPRLPSWQQSGILCLGHRR